MSETQKKKKRRKKKKKKSKQKSQNRRGFATTSVLKEKKVVKEVETVKKKFTTSTKKQRKIEREMERLRILENQRRQNMPVSAPKAAAPILDTSTLRHRRKRICKIQISREFETKACDLLRSSNDRTLFKRAALWASTRHRSLNKRLVANWLSLESLKFDRDLIRSAMLHTGGCDLEATLNWICIQSDELPVSWTTHHSSDDTSTSNTVRVEKMIVTEEKEDRTKEIEDEKMELVKLEKIVKEESTTTTTTSAQSILALAEQQERQARLEFEKEERERAFELLNPSDKYDVLRQRRQDLRDRAREAKQSSDESSLRKLSSELRAVSIQLRDLESKYPALQKRRKEEEEREKEERRKVAEQKLKEKEEKEEVSLGSLFSAEPTTTTVSTSPSSSTPTTPPKIIDMTFSASRANPKSVLLEWSSNAFKFVKVGIIANGAERWRVEIKNTFTKVRDVPKSLLSCVSISSISMPESTYGKSSKIAQNYLALMALFLFYPGQSVYTRFDDSCRDLWISWLEEMVRSITHLLYNKKLNRIPTTRIQVHEAKSLSTQDDNERDEFLSDLVAKLRSCSSVSESKTIEKTEKEKPRRTKTSRLNDEESEQEELKFHHNELPMLTKRKEFLSLVENNDVVIVVGETGSGKSTQIPQYL